MKTPQERNAYMRDYMRRRYGQRRARALEILGGVCVVCGTTEDLRIARIPGTARQYHLSRVFATLAWAKVVQELAGCRAICPPCHRAELSNMEHGLGLTGKHNCRCHLCAPLKDRYLRTLRINRALAQEFEELQREGEEDGSTEHESLGPQTG